MSFDFVVGFLTGSSHLEFLATCCVEGRLPHAVVLIVIIMCDIHQPVLIIIQLEIIML